MNAAEFDSGEDGHGQLKFNTWGCVLLMLTWTAILVLAAVCWKIVAIAWAWATL